MHDTPGTTAPVGLRERKKAARREALITASHRLVCEHGLDAVTVEMICDQVGVSSRTFFNYFESKVDAVLGIQAWALPPEVAAAFAAGGPSGNLLTDCSVVAESILADTPVDHDRMVMVMELAKSEPMLLVRQLAWFEERTSEIENLAARRNGLSEPGATEKTVGAVVILIVRSALTHWDLAGRRTTPVTHLPHVMAELRELFRPEN